MGETVADLPGLLDGLQAQAIAEAAVQSPTAWTVCRRRRLSLSGAGNRYQALYQPFMPGGGDALPGLHNTGINTLCCQTVAVKS